MCWEIASKQSTTILKLFCPCLCIACIERCFFTPWVSLSASAAVFYWCFKKEIAKSIWGMAWCKLRNVMLDIIHKWLSNMLPLSAITEKYRCGKKLHVHIALWNFALCSECIESVWCSLLNSDVSFVEELIYFLYLQLCYFEWVTISL